jgi:hypothetical protein
MNTDSLGRLYDRFTPRERLPLLIAAARRGDRIELHRLQDSAPKEDWTMPDYVHHVDAFFQMVHFHVETVMDLGMHFWQWWGLCMARAVHNQAGEGLGQKKRGQATAAKRLAARYGCLVRYYAARFVAHVDGWKQFCAELHVDPEAALDYMTGWDNIVRTESRVRELAFSTEDAAWFVRFETVPVLGNESQQKSPEPVETVAQVVAGWHQTWTLLLRSSIDAKPAETTPQDPPWYGEKRP